MDFKKLNIIYGHYGTGKTNFTLNAATSLAKQGKGVMVVDLDIVNPYFRSSDYKQELEGIGVRLISPKFANTTLEAPALSADIAAAFTQEDGHVFFDVGGDDAGAYALGRYADNFLKSGDWQALFVINKFRQMISMPGEAVSLMRQIEAASHLAVSGIVNNSHVSELTTAEDVLEGQKYAEEIADFAGLPLLSTTVSKKLLPELEGKINNIFPIDVLVSLPWNKA